MDFKWEESMIRKYVIILIATLLVVIPILRGNATEILSVRGNSESGKTRVVIELKEPTQYQLQYTSEPGISICLLETNLGAINRDPKISNELVKALSLKEIMGSMVEMNITLNKNADFNIFPLESPYRIVVDITPAEMIGDSQKGQMASSVTESMDMEVEDMEKATSDAGSKTVLDSLLPFETTSFILAQLCFNIFIAAGLVFVGFRYCRISRFLKRSLIPSEGKQNFADTLGEIQQERDKKDKTKKSESKVYNKNHKKHIAEEPVKQSDSVQKQYKKVQELARLGMNPLAIAQQSNVPIGEVNLILELSRAASQGKPN